MASTLCGVAVLSGSGEIIFESVIATEDFIARQKVEGCMSVIGIDPGRDKCGLAVLSASGEIIFESVIATAELEATLKKILAQNEIELAILGDGTTHKAAEKIFSGLGLSVKIVDEKHTTEEARRLYWQKNPPRGWRKLLPTSLQVPPEPVDGIVAEILVRRFLAQR